MLITAVLENKQGTKDGDQHYVDISSNWAQFRVLVSVDDFKKKVLLDTLSLQNGSRGFRTKNHHSAPLLEQCNHHQ